MSNVTAYSKQKDALYQRIQKTVEIQTGQRISRENARFLFDLIVEEVFIGAAELGSFRLNSGLGVIGIHENQPARRKLPNGDWTEYEARRKLRLTPGKLAKELVERSGDMNAFLAQRRTPARDFLNVDLSRSGKRKKKEIDRTPPPPSDPLDDLAGGSDEIDIG